MALPQFIFGMHDPAGGPIIQNAGKPGWVVASIKVNPPDTDGNYSALANAGIGVIARLNNGYEADGTLPPAAQYDQFAQQCAALVAGSKGVSIWIIGNETNSSAEWPGHNQPISAASLAQCFAKCRAKIRALPGHANDWVIPSAPAPWNAESGDWVKYFQDTLTQCIALGQKPDALAIHTYSRAMDPGTVTTESRMDPPFQMYHNNFRTYRDFLAVVPVSLKTVPVFITETQVQWWQNQNTGWVQAAFKEINDWNAIQTNQPIQALCLFRWERGNNDWSISDKAAIQDDYRAAMLNSYRTRWAAAQPPPPPPPTDPAAKPAQEAAVVHKPWMPINDGSALYKFALKNDLGYPQTDEFEFPFGGDTYIGQVYNLGIVYVKKFDWANCKWVKKPDGM